MVGAVADRCSVPPLQRTPKAPSTSSRRLRRGLLLSSAARRTDPRAGAPHNSAKPLVFFIVVQRNDCLRAWREPRRLFGGAPGSSVKLVEVSGAGGAGRYCGGSGTT